ncbi:hypothetical protein AALB53_00175 [Lachnospiraceae bacterium 47-T17]
MSEKEYIVQRAKLGESIEKINEQIGCITSDGWQQSISDEVRTAYPILSYSGNERIKSPRNFNSPEAFCE